MFWKATSSYRKVDEAGQSVIVTEENLIDGVSFTEVEKKAHKLILGGTEDFSVTKITKYPLAELVIEEEGEHFWRVKVVYFSVNETNGKEKRIVNRVLVRADDVQSALDRTREAFKQFLIPYIIEGIDITKILEVYPHVPEENEVQPEEEN